MPTAKNGDESSVNTKNGDFEEALDKKANEANGTDRVDNLQLEEGEYLVRVRERWWQIWMPRDPPPRPPKSLDEAKITPIVSASLISKLTYSWISPMMVLGYQRTLEASDLWKVHESQEARVLSAQLDQAWRKRVEQAAEWNAQIDNGFRKPGILKRSVWKCHGKAYEARMLEAWREKDGRKEPSLAWALNDVLGRMFWAGGLFKVIGDTAQLCGPILIKQIIQFAQQRTHANANGEAPPSVGRGIGMAIGLFLLVITSSLCQHQFFWRSMITGVLARTALISSIYKRSVMMTPKSRMQFSNAGIMTHISSDVSRVDNAAQWFHAAWTAPIQIIVCLIILVVQMGPSALAGFGIFFLLVPVQQRIMAHQIRVRKKSTKFTEQRAGVLMEVLSSMKIVKYFCYEIPFLNRINEVRVKELKGIRAMLHVQSAILGLALSTPVLAATLAFVTYTSTTPGFNVAVIFSSFSLFQLLRQPMMFLPRSLSATADASHAVERLKVLFDADVLTKDDSVAVVSHQASALKVENATFEWETGTGEKEKKAKAKELGESEKKDADVGPFRVSHVTIDVPRGKLVAFVGRVGSGKSSLLQGLIGEMRRVEGDAPSFGGKVAYCAQTAWIQNATLRENVLFGQPFKEDRYWDVVERACLVPDLLMLPDGDLTEIGEKGINLSGGQRQRVNIARALYFNADIIILDDPLSAVDAHVGQSLFHDAILPLAHTEGKTVLLITHAQHFLAECDYIYTLERGRIAEHGPYAQLIQNQGEFARLDKEFGGHKAQEEDDSEGNIVIQKGGHADLQEVKIKSELKSSGAAGTGKLEGRLIRKEARSVGSVSWTVYKNYLSAGTWIVTMPLALLSVLLMQGSQIMNSYTLVWWQANTFNRGFGFYQLLYAMLGVASMVSTLAVGLAVDFMSIDASKSLHYNAVKNILYAKMEVFDTTPTGRIMGVFGKDVDGMDNQLPTSIRMFVITAANALGSIAIVTAIEHYFIVVAIAILVGYQYFAAYYRGSAREMKRLDSLLRSLLYGHLSESLTGLATIRSYGEVPRFLKDTDYYVDLENRALLLTVTNQRWLAVRLDSLGALLIFVVAIFTVCNVSGSSAAQVGLVLTYMTSLTQMMGLFTRQSAEVENYMNAVERVVQYSQGGLIEQEAPHHLPPTDPPTSPSWPEHGAIKFTDVSLSYRKGLPTVLHNMSLDIKGGERIGVVGRTGAGKSSMMLSLLRIVELTGGKVEIDGVDISKLGLEQLRSNVSIIPQEPILFSGTVRTTLDPFSKYEDVRLWDALKRSYLVDSDLETDKPSARSIGLDTVIEAEGANLSVGERSLLSLARALVKDAKVVILDEATASVDLETDRKIQETIQTHFSDKTLLCIAHRLRTIISYDRILVLDSGRVVEFDTPQALYRNEDGIFRSLCEGSNISEADIEKISL